MSTWPERSLPLLATLYLRAILACSIPSAALLFVLLCAAIVALDGLAFRKPPHPSPLTAAERRRATEGGGGGIANWRSLGGLPTSDGSRRRVKEGVAYRSGELKGLSTSLGVGGRKGIVSFPVALKTVVDLRERGESAAARDRIGPDTQLVCIPLSPLRRSDAVALMLHNSKSMVRMFVLHPYGLFQPPGNHTPIDDVPLLAVSRVVTEPRFGDEAVRRLILLAADPANHPILWHCATGKDRTGGLTAVFLLALGISREDAIQDFLLSNTLGYDQMAQRYHLMKFLWLLTGSWRSFVLHGGRRLQDMLFVRKEALEGAMAEVDTRYGGFGPAYWRAQGLTGEDLDRLRAAMLR